MIHARFLDGLVTDREKKKGRLPTILLVFPELPQDNVFRIYPGDSKTFHAQLLVHTKNPVLPFSLVLQVIDLGQESSPARSPVLEADTAGMFPGRLEDVQHGHPRFPVDCGELFFHSVPVVDDKHDFFHYSRSLPDGFLRIQTERADQQTENQFCWGQVPISIFVGNGSAVAEVATES